MGNGKSGHQMAADNLARFQVCFVTGNMPRIVPTTGAATGSAEPILRPNVALVRQPCGRTPHLEPKWRHWRPD